MNARDTTQGLQGGLRDRLAGVLGYEITPVLSSSYWLIVRSGHPSEAVAEIPNNAALDEWLVEQVRLRLATT